MVQIAVKIPDKDGKCQEWAIVELQGDLETRHPIPLSGKFIGDLHFTHKDAPVLIIGHHILHGKVISLEKPLAVITKVADDCERVDVTVDKNIMTSQANVTMDTNTETSQSAKVKEETCYHVQAIIKTKILFKTRPKPIIAHVPKKL